MERPRAPGEKVGRMRLSGLGIFWNDGGGNSWWEEEEEEGEEEAITSFGILALRRARPSHSPCTVVSELIALKQLIIERGEVQRRSKKAIKRTPGSELGRGDSSVAQPATAAAAGGPELNRTVTGKPAAGCEKKKKTAAGRRKGPT